MQAVLRRLFNLGHLEGEAGGLDLFLAGHEDEDVPRWMPQVAGDGLLDGCIHIVLLHSPQQLYKLE